MKLKFDSNLDYQQEAISAVIDVFRGQKVKQTLFPVSLALQSSLAFDGGQGIGNKLNLDKEELLKNIRDDVSKHVGEAPQSDDITLFALRFKGAK